MTAAPMPINPVICKLGRPDRLERLESAPAGAQ